MSKIERNCNNCGETYIAETRYVNRGQGLYCKKACGLAMVKQKAIERGNSSKEPNVICSFL